MEEVAIAVKAALERDARQSILIFDDAAGRTLDFDLRGTRQDVLRRLAGSADDGKNEAATAATKIESEIEQLGERQRTPGRPKLGVVAREVTLFPRHWDWLNAQPGGASVALRKLVEAARKASVEADKRRRAVEAADRFMCSPWPATNRATKRLHGHFMRVTKRVFWRLFCTGRKTCATTRSGLRHRFSQLPRTSPILFRIDAIQPPPPRQRQRFA